MIMTDKEKEYLEKQKQVFYVTQRIEGAKGFEKTTYGLVIDCLLDNQNSFISLQEISKQIKAKNIMIEPETIHETLLHLNYHLIFEHFPEECDIQTPIKLSKNTYDNFKSTSDYTLKLKNYIARFLEKENKPISFLDRLTEILLEAIFYCNIKFLNNILSAKDKASIQNLFVPQISDSDDEEIEATKLFNLLLQTSTREFDEILRALILKMFDFLSLNFNPNYAKRIEKNFKGNYYYLDSSFILRLLGFDGEFRQERSLELIKLLQGIPEVKFIVHVKSIEETNNRIKEVIGKNLKVISRKPEILESIILKDGDISYKSPVIFLYLRLFKEGKIRNANDFALYWNNVKARLLSIVNNLEFDSNKLPSRLTAGRKKVVQDLTDKTDKSRNRIQFIASLLDYIDSKRGSNNFNFSDIKYWLITTDQKTLSSDERYLKDLDAEFSHNKKSICIMPSEIIRILDGFNGEIKTDHIGVFKNYMMKSHIFPRQYTDDELTTISRIAGIVEMTNLEQYDAEEMIDNLMKESSIKDIQRRLDRFKLQKQKDEEIINIFIERNESILGEKVSSIFYNAHILAEKRARRNWQIYTSSIIILFAFIIFSFVFNWGRIFNLNTDDFFDLDIWSLIEFLAFIGTILLFNFTSWKEKLKTKYIAYYINKEISALKNPIE